MAKTYFSSTSHHIYLYQSSSSLYLSSESLSLIAARKGHSPPRFIGNASAVPFASPCMPLDCNLQRPRPPASLPPFLSPSPMVLRCLPRITVSCPSRIRICPRIRHVWGPDRIYRALNAAYRKSISGSHSQQQLLFISLSLARSFLLLSFLSRTENFLFSSLYRVGVAHRSSAFRLIFISTSPSRPFG